MRWKKIMVMTLGLLAFLAGIPGPALQEVSAKATTVTVKYGSDIWYGTEINGFTTVKWVTHIDGEAVDLDDVAGVSRSYAYCVEPMAFAPDPGTYSVTLIDDDDSGRIAKMRKLIYYLPGSYGYSKVTKKKWFSGYSVNEAYVVGHLALSWIYDRYSDSSTVWGGAPSSTVSKAKSIVSDLSKLDDPPDDYEVFWIKVSGKQDVFGAFYATEYGEAKVVKDSANKTMTNDNSCYSLQGAEYTMYEDASCSEIVKDADGKNAVLKIGADGSSGTMRIETGTYYIKETKAPKGYALDTSAHSIEVIKDKTTTFTAHDIPKSNQVELLIQKLDKETGLAKPQGGASLEGAEYTVKYYDVAPSSGMSEEQMTAAVAGRPAAKVNGKEAIWVFRTDEQGRIDMSQQAKYLISEKSADLYLNSAGKAAFPIGIISICETAAPEGYLIDDTIRYAAIYDTGSVEELGTLKTFTDERGLKEQVKRGDLSLKKSAEGRARMSGVKFSFTSLTTGESHVLVTDRNGYLSSASAWNAHDSSTNRGESAEDGIWFNGYNDEETGARVNSSLGALPYDKYLLEEIRSDANEGYELISDVISIERDSICLDLGTYDDEKEPVPSIATQAKDAFTNTDDAEASDVIVIVDTVEYVNVKPGKTYTVDGILMDKETGKPLLDDDGNEVTSSAELYAESDHGKVELSFTFPGKSLAGKSAVVFENLILGGKVVARHSDIKSKEQTVNIKKPDEPKISTTARDSDSGTHTAIADEDVTIVDKIMYENLTVGETYIVEGVLMNKADAKPLTDDEGEIVRGSTEFTAASKDGSVEVEFTLNAKSLAGKSTVVYEYLSLDGESVTSHTDIKSAEQTVKFKGVSKGGGPDTGDDIGLNLLYCLLAMAISAEALLLTQKHRNDRLN